MSILSSEKRNQHLGKRFAHHLLVGGLEGESILQLTHQKGARSRIVEPFLHFMEHVLPVLKDGTL